MQVAKFWRKFAETTFAKQKFAFRSCLVEVELSAVSTCVFVDSKPGSFHKLAIGIKSWTWYIVVSDRDDESWGLKVELLSRSDAVVVKEPERIEAIDRRKEDEAVDVLASEVTLTI